MNNKNNNGKNTNGFHVETRHALSLQLQPKTTNQPLQPYPKYKPSGIAWLGEIPEHWEVKKARNIGVFNGSTVDKKIDDSQEKVRLVNFLDVYNNPIFEIYEKKFMVVSVKKEQIKKFKVNIGDMVFTPSSEVREDIGRSAVIKYEADDLLHSYHVIRLKFRENLNIDFKKYLFNNHFVLKYFSKVCTGSTRKILTRQNFNNIELVIPPFLEQTAIATFLDFKLAKIDRFIRKKKQLIKLLNEQKAGIINDAVTKGLNPNIKTKPSGIEWLGDIPEHWEIVKLTGVCGFVRGNSSFRKDELLSNGKYVALQYGKTYKVNEVDEKYQFYVNDEFYKVSQIVNFGDVIFISTSETIEDLGHSVFYNRSDLGLLGGEQILLKPKNDIVNGKYLCYSSKIFAKELKKYATGVKVYRFNVNDLKTIYTSIPPIHEQKAIVAHIEAETAIINKTIATIEKEIALVQEYRTALIAEAVTGKIDVRDFEINEELKMENEEEGSSPEPYEETEYETEEIE